MTCNRQWWLCADTLRLLTPRNCPWNSLAGATSAQSHSTHRIWQQTYAIFHFLNFCITLSSKKLTDDSTVATLAFSRVSTLCSPFHISVFSDLLSRSIAWIKLLNLALKWLNLPSIWLNLASNPRRISTTVCKLIGSYPFCACAWHDIPSAWSMLTFGNCSPAPGKALLPGFPSVGLRTGCKLAEVSSLYIILYKLIDTWVLDSNRRVGVWSLPWGWHILSIPLRTGRGTSAETCGLDNVLPPDDIGSRPEALC